MVEKIKNNKYQIIELIIVFLITLLFNLICSGLVDDEIWTYGFSYNIASGLIPYKDFNMVITPLFPLLAGTIMWIFGKNMIVYHIFNAIICITIFRYIKKISSKSYYIPYSILLIYSNPHYNLLCLMLLLILIHMEDKKTNDYLIGITIGVTFLVKQNIGVFLYLPTLFTKNIKKIIKRGLGVIIPNIIMLIYLIYTNSLYEFIDYTILGLSDFSEKNSFVSISCIAISLLSLTYSILKYIKTKDIKFIYMICFHGMLYPIIEPYRVILVSIPTITYFLKDLNLNKKIISYAFAIFIIGIFSYYLYLYSTNEYNYPNVTTVFKYRKMLVNDATGAQDIANYINKIEDEIFIISTRAYMLKLETQRTINKYDLLNNGNMGKNGEIKIINEIKEQCNNKRCTFIIDLNSYSNNKLNQYNREIFNYITTNYELTEKLKNYNILIYKSY